ncbi:PIG-P family protein [Theileria parva strain Muguga]|uniref:PIG-P family protein n=1 Tax=Theileria parva strain Muguga TaxID=333668 RepID=UPI001C6217E6|nr:PIG-P family protein [Theileria parva strain Muguga]EAN31992.2 PIG-P family protein [Theileria parva strain Muguga]
MDFEIKVFVSVLSCYSLFVIYVVWAYVPDRFFNKIGIIYYPSKHWSCAFPILVVFGAISLVVFIGFFERTKHPRLDSFDSMIDEYSTVENDGGIMYFDAPIELVNEKLYTNVQS